MLPQKTATQIAYMRVIVFAAAAFVVNTTEFIPVALLSDIGKGFGLPVSQVGLMITVYAWIVTLLSLPFMLLTAKIERKKLLLGLFTVFISGHILTVCSWNFEVLLLSRTIIAMSHAIFWAITSALVMRVAPKGKQQQALGWLSLGTAMAMILGLPLGRIIGQLLGWRTTFALIAVLAAVLMALMYKLLPKMESKNTGSLKSVPILFKRPLLVGLYFLTMTAVTAHFTAYSYIEPFVLQISKMGAGMATAVLLVFGVSGIIASTLFGRLHPQYPQPFIFGALALLIISLLLLVPLSGSHIAMFGLIFVWGIAISCLGLCMIIRVLSYAPDATDVATAMYSGIFNIGIGGGAFLGGVVMHETGLHNIGWVGAALAMVATGVFAWVQWRFKNSAPVK
ncbi:sugar transporter [Neisseriaceae bacterium B1]